MQNTAFADSTKLHSSFCLDSCVSSATDSSGLKSNILRYTELQQFQYSLVYAGFFHITTFKCIIQ